MRSFYRVFHQISASSKRWIGRRSNSTSSFPTLLDVLRRVQDRQLSPEEAAQLIAAADDSSIKALKKHDDVIESFANLDHYRYRRTGFPEVVFAEGKTAQQVAHILDDMARKVNESSDSYRNRAASSMILATRVTPELFEQLSSFQLSHGTIVYHSVARIVSMKASSVESLVTDTATTARQQRVVVATAGTTDLPVAEEAAVLLEAAGCVVDRIYDVGVAGLHRILNALPRLRHPDVECVIVVAGMDGALPSVVGGLVSVPVIAVPTSIGYGASFGGLSALLTMLNTCSPGVGVVNIDNGFGAAALAWKCLQKLPEED